MEKLNDDPAVFGNIGELDEFYEISCLKKCRLKKNKDKLRLINMKELQGYRVLIQKILFKVLNKELLDNQPIRIKIKFKIKIKEI